MDNENRELLPFEYNKLCNYLFTNCIWYLQQAWLETKFNGDQLMIFKNDSNPNIFYGYFVGQYEKIYKKLEHIGAKIGNVKHDDLIGLYII